MHAVLANQTKEVMNAVRRLEPDRVLSVPVADLVADVYQKFCVNRLELRWDDRTSSGVNDAHVSVGGWGGASVEVDGSRVEVLVPFDGDAVLFDVQPSTFTMNPPRFDVRGRNVVLGYEGRSPLDADAMKASIESLLGDIQKHIDWQNAEIDPWNTNVRSDLSTRVAERRNKVLADRELEGFLNVPVVGRDNPSPIMAVDPPKRPRALPVPRGSTKAFVPEPAITDAGFSDILNAIESVNTFVQRLPGTFENMPEESLRDILLTVLNNQFGPASGETFSRRGKTDILIPYDGDTGAVFIAECKWWKGPAAFRKAIDQILGYLTWRDTHAALIVFVRAGSPAAVEEKAVAELEAHGGYKRTFDSHGRRLYTVANATDPDRELHLALLIIPVLA